MKKVLFIIGVALIGSSVWMYQTNLEEVKFSDSPVATENSNLSIEQNTTDLSGILKNLTNCLGCMFDGSGGGVSNTEIILDIKAPKDINVNDTLSVVLEYKAILNGKKSYENLPPNIPTLNGFTLHSSGFDITPNKSIEVQQETKLPLTVMWTITPKKAGKSVLLLDIAETLLEKDKGHYLTSYKLDNEKISGSDLRSIKLPISVYTLWGISAFSFELIKLLSILVGGILTYPLLIEALKPFVVKKNV